MDDLKSLGEKIIRTNINNSGNSDVDEIKKLTAILINVINTLPSYNSFEDQGEVTRLKDLAITHIEIASMFAVKMMTCKKVS